MSISLVVDTSVRDTYRRGIGGGFDSYFDEGCGRDKGVLVNGDTRCHLGKRSYERARAETIIESSWPIGRQLEPSRSIFRPGFHLQSQLP